jgi:hypothetical protein
MTGGFLSKIGEAGASVKSFVGSMVSLGAITDGVMHAIENATALEHLHKRTGESVASLVKLQGGFKAAGLSAEDVGPALFYLSKSLGGVNEFGEGTAATFNRMGLSMAKLKAMGAPQAMAAILGSLKAMNQSDATKAASVIFGRGEAGNMLQLARSTGEFAEGMAKAASKANLLQQNAAVFARLNRTMGEIKDHASTMFAGIAVGIAPAMLAVEKKLADLDLAGFGENLGNEITIAFEEVNLGKFGEYFKLILESAAFDAGNVFGKIMQKAFAPPSADDKAKGKGGFWEKYGRSALASAELSLSILPLLGGWLHIPGSQKAGDSLIDKAYANWQKSFDPIAKLIDLAADIGGAITKGALGDQPNPYAAALLNRRRNDLDRARKKGSHFEDDWIPTGGAPDVPQTKHTPEFTQWEKMGLVMSGLGNVNLSNRIAVATERGADAAQNTAKFIQDFLESTHPDWLAVHDAT